MKFEKFMVKLKGAQDRFAISAIDLIILDDVASSKEKVTIMGFLERFWRTSPWRRIEQCEVLASKRNCSRSRLTPEDGRVKLLTVGEKYNDLVKYVEAV